MDIRVQQAAFDLGHEASTFAANQQGQGAIVTFTGIVRDLGQGDLHAMEIEHYPGMTEKALQAIAADAMARWALGDILIIHRHGRLAPQDLIMMVATSSKHRKDAFEAAEFLMDYLKSRAPFWKREVTGTGAEWVAAKDADETALSRWDAAKKDPIK
jgi:molybdopterin synthase catalytic subunit